MPERTDGAADLTLGSRAHTLNDRSDPNFNDAGAVYVLYGGSDLLAAHIYLPIAINWRGSLAYPSLISPNWGS